MGMMSAAGWLAGLALALAAGLLLRVTFAEAVVLGFCLASAGLVIGGRYE